MDDEPPRGQPGDDSSPEIDRQIRALTEIVGMLAARSPQPGNGRTAPAFGQRGDVWDPAPWVWKSPYPPNKGDAAEPQSVVENFVEFYNDTYVGLAGSKAKPIPSCWRDHPGLAMEVATLAHAWLAANLGASADIRDAQAWHHQLRPAFMDRLARDWVGSDCFDGLHIEADHS